MGQIGFDAGAWTLAEIETMADARRKLELDGASIVAAMIINTNRKRGTRAVSPIECHPYRTNRRQTAQPITKQNISKIGAAFVSIYGGR